MKEKPFILNYIKKQDLAILATVSENFVPEAAAVGFAISDSFEIVFGTSNLSRKYPNLLKNPNVALVIGWDDHKTVQIEGRSVELEGKELAELKSVYFSKHPTARKYEANLDQRYFKVVPKWIRYTDIGKTPWEIKTLNF